LNLNITNLYIQIKIIDNTAKNNQTKKRRGRLISLDGRKKYGKKLTNI